MTGDLRGELLRQRAQLDARVLVQLLAGDVVGQDRIVVLRRCLLVPLARRPVRAPLAPRATGAGRPVTLAPPIVETPGTGAPLTTRAAGPPVALTAALPAEATPTTLTALTTAEAAFAALASPTTRTAEPRRSPRGPPEPPPRCSPP
ncbi:hypothetical protein [Spirillospora albida]|uniref:hypothetical protein n=1 Tax=Spirillospora albida TaxID=58123 RepID=UPI0004C1A2D7|nr:hypothetical protein [Spirillospora albida]